MNRAIVTALLLSAATAATAQNKNQVWVSLGNISSFTMVNNKPTPAITTCAAILENPVLIVKKPGAECAVIKFTFSISSGKNATIKGPVPVQGAALNEEARKLLTENAGSNGTVFIEDIKVNCEDGMKTARNITLKYAN